MLVEKSSLIRVPNVLQKPAKKPKRNPNDIARKVFVEAI